MSITKHLLDELRVKPVGKNAMYYFRALGLTADETQSYSMRRANAVTALFTKTVPTIYKNDLIVGSFRPLWKTLDESEEAFASEVNARYGERNFITNFDHFAPDYDTVLTVGITGLLDRIDSSKEQHRHDAERLDFLDAMRQTLLALRTRLLLHAERAHSLLGTDGYDDDRLHSIEARCTRLADHPPRDFAEALQLVWMIHSGFVMEGRYAMALGRMDQYLYPFYRRDLQNGTLTQEDATTLLENVFVKIHERFVFRGDDDVVNICIGGTNIDGTCAVNELSYAILYAVRNVKLPGPNLSARISPETPDAFLDACLKVIGTGLGYPALMNDTVNMEALRRYGYDEEDVRNYCMVGCIENFLPGSQPPWSDGRFDTPRFLEYVFNEGKGIYTEHSGIHTGKASELTSMQDLMEKFERQLAHGVEEYVRVFERRNRIPEPEKFTSPFLSCFCKDCIGRGLDVNAGGAKYPSIHGAGLMGIGTICDSLAAIEKVIFDDRQATPEELAEALKQNFVGHEALREKLLAAPKYGNNDPYVDKYAVWFVKYLSDQFLKYKTYDGGGIYVAIAANTANISAGKLLSATPDGRLAGEPLSDAASPTYGKDTRGATSTILSLTKPDYTRAACGTVVNQKYSPAMFEDGKRQKLLALIRVYFEKGGQEIQINATSTEVLWDAMEHPERYPNLVVRVSGFSALYVTLNRDVQRDILQRTQQE